MPAYYPIPLKQGATYDQVFQLLQENGTPVPGLSTYTGTHLFQVRTAPVDQGGSVVTTGALTITDAANAKIRVLMTPAQSRLVKKPTYVYAAELVKTTGEVWVAQVGDFTPLTLEIAL